MLGLKPIKIEVEVDAGRGQPKLIIIGLPSRIVTESKERITSALQNCGVRIRAKRTVVNLAPADIHKRDSCFELAIVASLLKEYGVLKQDTDQSIFFGELSLGGEVRGIRAALPLIMAAIKMGFESAFVPKSNIPEIQHLKGINIYPIGHLSDLVRYANGQKLPKLPISTLIPVSNQRCRVALSDIIGQNLAKRALEIAAAGGHNLMMVGPPGSGKSMLAQSIISILPPMTEKEIIEASSIHSLLGKLESGLITTRPFRSPHHTTPIVSLIGGGIDLLPGEITLAHRGVLFLDELSEFNRYSLESLREPLQEGFVTIKRLSGTARYPANFSLIAATNPCPCGYYGSNHKKCHCSPQQIERYQKKLSGPLKDRVDLQVFVNSTKPENFSKPSGANQTTDIAQLVAKARQKQLERYQNANIVTNSELSSKLVKQLCHLTEEAEKLLVVAANKMSLTSRGYFSVIKVSQTIADLDDSGLIERRHLEEALQYRIT